MAGLHNSTQRRVEHKGIITDTSKSNIWIGIKKVEFQSLNQVRTRDIKRGLNHNLIFNKFLIKIKL